MDRKCTLRLRTGCMELNLLCARTLTPGKRRMHPHGRYPGQNKRTHALIIRTQFVFFFDFFFFFFCCWAGCSSTAKNWGVHILIVSIIQTFLFIHHNIVWQPDDDDSKHCCCWCRLDVAAQQSSVLLVHSYNAIEFDLFRTLRRYIQYILYAYAKAKQRVCCSAFVCVCVGQRRRHAMCRCRLIGDA